MSELTIKRRISLETALYNLQAELLDNHREPTYRIIDETEGIAHYYQKEERNELEWIGSYKLSTTDWSEYLTKKIMG